jgi:xanthine dehydrogenase accessory factor
MQTHPLDRNVHQAVVDFIDGGAGFALATVLKHAGSTPQVTGVKAVIDSAGSIWGTIGGGVVEAHTIELAAQALRTMQPTAFDFEFGGTRVDAGPPICGGSMRVLIDPTVAVHRGAYAAAADAYRRRERGVLIATIVSKDPLQVRVHWLSAADVPSEAGFPSHSAVQAALAQDLPTYFVEDQPQADATVEVLVEPVVPAPRLVVFGGGHVGQALALQAGLVGFEIVIIEDRAEYAQPELFPSGAIIQHGDMVATLNQLMTDRDTYIVLVSRGHEHDADALAVCIRKPTAYLGMIGSRRKVALVREAFINSGLASEEEFDRVHAPVGLDIGALTVPEIATSIVAELVAVRRTGGSHQSLRRSGPK